MLKLILTALLAFALAGCGSIGARPLTGTQLETKPDGGVRLVTYVSQQEFENMTPADRQRLNAAVGSSVTVPIAGSKAPPEYISEDDYKKAYAK